MEVTVTNEQELRDALSHPRTTAILVGNSLTFSEPIHLDGPVRITGRDSRVLITRRLI